MDVGPPAWVNAWRVRMTNRSIMPVERYQDVGASAEWLCSAFSFQEIDAATAALRGKSPFRIVCHGQSWILVSPVSGALIDDLMAQPAAIGGFATQISYLTVSDVDAHADRAALHGARIEVKPQSDDRGDAASQFRCDPIAGHAQLRHERDAREAAESKSRQTEAERIRAETARSQAERRLAVVEAQLVRTQEAQNKLAEKLVARVWADDRSNFELSILRQAMARPEQLTVQREQQERSERRQLVATMSQRISRQEDERKKLATMLAAANKKHVELAQALQRLAKRAKQGETTIAALQAQRTVSKRHLARANEALMAAARIMSGSVSWGGGTNWCSHNARRLCGDSQSANRTISCFSSKVSQMGWRKALNACK